MMSRLSVKQRLIIELEDRASSLEDDPEYDPDEDATAWTYRQDARALKGRGSGPLPWWAKSLAREWGIE